MNSNSHYNRMCTVKICQDHKIRMIETKIQKFKIVARLVFYKKCGTDLHILKGNFIGISYPITLGYEFIDHVILEKIFIRFKEKSFVSVSSNIVFDHYKWCHMERSNLCSNLISIPCADKFKTLVNVTIEIKGKIQRFLKAAFQFTHFEKAIDHMHLENP